MSFKNLTIDALELDILSYPGSTQYHDVNQPLRQGDYRQQAGIVARVAKREKGRAIQDQASLCSDTGLL